MNGALFIGNRQRAVALDGRHLRRLALFLLRESLRVDNFQLGICLVRAAEMTRLNETHLRHAGPTDVITFDYATDAPRFRRSPVKARSQKTRVGTAIHGEIFVCIDEAMAQARRFRTSWQSELTRYVIHGGLHLLGYDDLRPTDRRKMKREEGRLLRQLARRFPLRKLARDTKLRP